MPTQIHIYTINRGSLDEFATEWRDKIKPLREKYGFHVSGGWKVKETNQFVLFLSRDTEDDWDLRIKRSISQTNGICCNPILPGILPGWNSILSRWYSSVAKYRRAPLGLPLRF